MLGPTRVQGLAEGCDIVITFPHAFWALTVSLNGMSLAG